MANAPATAFKFLQVKQTRPCHLTNRKSPGIFAPSIVCSNILESKPRFFWRGRMDAKQTDSRQKRGKKKIYVFFFLLHDRSLCFHGRVMGIFLSLRWLKGGMGIPRSPKVMYDVIRDRDIFSFLVSSRVTAFDTFDRPTAVSLESIQMCWQK